MTEERMIGSTAAVNASWSPSPPHKLNGAELLVDVLARQGVATVFGVPGDTGVGLYDAFFHRSSDVRHILSRDERHAAAMADAFARASNTVGVVDVSSGGGSTYVVGGLGESYAASVPVLVISSAIHADSRGTGALTELDETALYSAVTKWSTVARSASEIPSLVSEALEHATSGRPAPVALILPENVLDEIVDTPPSSPASSQHIALPRHRESADPESVHAAAHKINGATAPVIVAGSGVHMSAAWDALELLADHAAIPVATTIHGKGAISDGSAWSLGIVGANGAREYANRRVSRADVVLLIGTRANATDTNGWTAPIRTHPDIISINICADPAARNFPGSLPLVGDARTILTQLLKHVQPATNDQRLGRQSEVAVAAKAWTPPQPTSDELSGEQDRLAPLQIVQVAHRVLADHCTVVADPGTPTPNVAAYWDVPDSGRSVIIPRGHGPMGYAIPAAVGVALARPHKPVLAFTTDGSFAMASGELETVARLDLPIAYIQLTNFSLGWIKMLQHLYFGGRYFGVEPGAIDAVSVAEACGVRGVRVKSLRNLEDELTRFLDDRKPVYLNVDVPELIETPPPVAPWQAALKGATTRPVY